jgi:predicted Rossmann fold nucleotide-binding protein DprA/Smf involved in DNA uptake
MHIAIVGSRDYPDLAQVTRYVAAIARKYPDAVIVSGGARGVDQAAESAAIDLGLETIIHPADWDTHGKSAGFKRNALIVRDAEVVVAFQKNGSRGTQHSIDLARAQGKPVYVYSA